MSGPDDGEWPVGDWGTMGASWLLMAALVHTGVLADQ